MKENKNSWSISRYIQIILIVVIILAGVRYFVFNNNISEVNSIDPLSELGMEYYSVNYGEEYGTEGVEAVVKNFGCHKEIHILRIMNY